MNASPSRIVRWPALKKMLDDISRSTIDRWEAKGLFPRRIHLGANIIAWRLDEVQKWLEDKQ